MKSRKRCLVLLAALLLFASGASGSRAAQVEDGFVRLEGGTFLMGSPDSERQRQKDEVRHEVALSPFYVDPHEVTQGDWEALMGTNPSANRGAKLPVENVPWLDAVRYCNALSQKRGLTPAYEIEGEKVTWKRDADGYRLLTEAEWEYAARAGTTTVFNVGDRVHSDQVNFEATYPYLIEENYVHPKDPSVKPSHYRGRTLPVGSLPPNAFGLYDTHGNVSEWVFDYYAPYDLEAKDNPAGPARGTYRVNRGGSFIDFGKHLRSAYRSATNPLDVDPNLGFRVARNAEGTSSLGNMVCEAPFRIEARKDMKVLVACFSYSGNTWRAAEHLAESINAKLFRIEMAAPYRGNIYEATEIDLNADARPPLKGNVEDFDRYDVVLLGYPTWWATMPMPVATFLESHDFTGKIVLPFSSHGGTVWGDSVSDLSKAVPGAYVAPGFEFHYSGGRNLAKNLDAWLEASGLK